VTTYNPSAANANWRDTTASSDVAVSVPATATSAGGVLLATGAAIATLGDLASLHTRSTQDSDGVAMTIAPTSGGLALACIFAAWAVWTVFGS
jgi:hypothetical protein